MSRPRIPRSSSHNTPRQSALGARGTAGRPAPAWKGQAKGGNDQHATGEGYREGYQRMTPESGSKIFVTHLPTDVTLPDVKELFQGTVGPLKGCFLVYDNKGSSTGMAVVAFQRKQDAAIARKMYHGKLVDQQRPIRVELISDAAESPVLPPPALTLSQRLGPVIKPDSHEPVVERVNARPKGQPRPAVAPRPKAATQATQQPQPKVMQKKGPKRVKKVQERIQKKKKSASDLDQEMEEYRAADPEYFHGENGTA